MPNGRMEQAGIEAVIRNLSQFKAGAKEMDQAITGIGASATQAQAPVGRLQAHIDELAATAGSATLVFGGFAAAGAALIGSTAMLAARNEELDIVLGVVSKTMDISMKTIKEQEAELKDLGITTREARQALILFMQGELDVTDATKLASAARDLAVIGLKNTSQAYGDLTEAILTQRSIRLREYGITKTLNQIYEEYAKEVLNAGAAVTRTTTDNSQAMQTLGTEMEILRAEIQLNNEELALQIGYWGESDNRVRRHRLQIEKMNVRLGKMTERYNELAGGHGRVTETSKELSKELTDQQKKQAFLYAILKEGEKVLGVYEAAMEAPGKALRSLPRYIEEFASSLGEFFLEPLGIAVGLLTELLLWLGALPAESKKAIASFIGIGTAASGALASLAGFMLMKGPLAGALTFLTNPIGLLVAALGALAGAFVMDVGGIRTKTMPILQDFAATIRKTVIPILENLIRYFDFVLQTGDELNDWLTHLPKPIRPIVAGIGKLIVGIRDFVRYIAFVLKYGDELNDWLTHLPKSVQPIVGAIGGVVAFLREKIPAALEEVRQVVWAVIGGIAESMLTAWTTIRTWTEENWGTIQAFITTVLDWIRSFVELTIANVTEIFGSAWTIIREWTEENWPLIQETIQRVLEIIMNIVSFIMAAITAIWREYGQGLLETAQTIWDMIRVAIETIITAILGIIRAIMLLITGDWRGFLEQLKEVAQTIWEGIKTIVGLAIEKVRDILTSVMAVIREKWREAWTAMRDKMSEIHERIMGAIGKWLREIKQKIIDFKEKIMAAGRQLMMGLLEGMKEKADAIIDWILSLLRRIRGAVKDFFGFECPEPSRLMMRYGRQVMEGFILGLEQMRPALESQLRMTLAPVMQVAAPAATASPVLVQGGHTYNFNLSAQYAQVQSPASILDDLAAMQMLAQARG